MSEPEGAPLQRLTTWSQDELHLVQSVRMHEPVYANPAALRRDVRALLAEVDTLTRRLAHSERHRTMNRRSMRRRGRVIRQLGEKIAKQRAALRNSGPGGKRLSAMDRAASLHRSLRSGPDDAV